MTKADEYRKDIQQSVELISDENVLQYIDIFVNGVMEQIGIHSKKSDVSVE